MKASGVIKKCLHTLSILKYVLILYGVYTVLFISHFWEIDFSTPQSNTTTDTAYKNESR